jgi:hypothetical protein
VAWIDVTDQEKLNYNAQGRVKAPGSKLSTEQGRIE